MGEGEMGHHALVFCSGTFGSPLQARRRTFTKALLPLASWVGHEEILLPCGCLAELHHENQCLMALLLIYLSVTLLI